MKILNLHGFLGKADNRNYAALCEIMPKENIISPQIDFMKEKPDDIIVQLSFIADDEQPLIVMGQSLGGYLAYNLARWYSLPCILTNPCLFPERCDVIVNSGISEEILSCYHGSAKPTNDTWILCSDHDTIIPGNIDICRKITTNVQVVPGTHSKIPKLKEYLESILNKIENG